MTTLLRRGLLSVLLAFGLVLAPVDRPLVAQSSDNARYAAIVVDAESGEVLFARHADARRYPASITKVMTLYMAFEALAEGKVKPDDILTISPHAASQPPSKLGLAAGQTITLDDAMKATAVRSANDMAVAIAEHIGGSEARFTAQMTLKARELGMSSTRYVNANGLPDARQLTTARDLSILSRAVMRDYPQYYRYFGLHDWAFRGRDYRNTNGLLHGGRGYDGLKTGFTNASGYNLAASAVRDGRRLITIVLGGRSTATRNSHVADLMDTGFELERARQRGQFQMASQTFFEQKGLGVGPQSSTAVQYASLPDAEETGVGSTEAAYVSAPAPVTPPRIVTPAPSERVGVANAPSVTRTAPPPAAPTRPASSRPADITAILNGGAAPRGASTTAARTTARSTLAGNWSVQVGAFREESVAGEWLTEVQRRFRTQFMGAERTVQNADGWYRSRFTGMTEAAAQAACSVLAERRVTCMVVRPQG